MYLFLCIALLFAASNGEEVDIEGKDGVCQTRNGYYRVRGSCDAYVECRDYRPITKMCPDGLNFNYTTVWPKYPCNYPNEVPCRGRRVSQPPIETPDCPRQYGYFQSPLAAPNDCGLYRWCEKGRAHDLYCPFGLAFNMAKARCDWPESVPGCNADEFFGFTCPPPEYDHSGNPVVSNFRYEGDCYMFFSCEADRARILTCDAGLAFDVISRACIDADKVDCSYQYRSDEDSNSEIEEGA